MNDQHPITPPPELVQQWCLHSNKHETADQFWRHIATQAAQWGSDQELEACCKWLPKLPPWSANDLRKHRRPKPTSLKEQALMALEDGDIGPGASLTPVEVCIIRRALEALDD